MATGKKKTPQNRKFQRVLSELLAPYQDHGVIGRFCKLK